MPPDPRIGTNPCCGGVGYHFADCHMSAKPKRQGFPDGYWDLRTEPIVVDGLMWPATACKRCEKRFPPYMAAIPTEDADAYCSGHVGEDWVKAHRSEAVAALIETGVLPDRGRGEPLWEGTAAQLRLAPGLHLPADIIHAGARIAVYRVAAGAEDSDETRHGD